MKKHELILFVLTFVLGLFCGMMLYLMVYAPLYQNNNLTDISQLNFQLTGQAYGRCQQGKMVCPSFILNSDGTYTYIPWYSSAVDMPPPQHTGTLGTTQVHTLIAALKAANYTALQQPGGTCAANHGGTDYQYSVVINGVQQELDTCNTQFGQSSLATQLAPLWNEFDTAHTGTAQTNAPTNQGTFSSFLQNWFSAGNQGSH